MGRPQGKIDEVAETRYVVFCEAPETHAEIHGPCCMNYEAGMGRKIRVCGWAKPEKRIREFDRQTTGLLRVRKLRLSSLGK